MTKIEEKIITKKRFSEAVEKAIRYKGLTCIDAIVYTCEQNGLDPGEVNRLLSTSILQKVEAEAMKLNMIPKGNELPFD